MAFITLTILKSVALYFLIWKPAIDRAYESGEIAGAAVGIEVGLNSKQERVIKPSKKQAKLAAAGIDYAELDAYRRLYGPLK